MAAEEKVMTFREHLGELKTVVVRSLAFLLLGFLVGWEFRREIFGFLSAPITSALADNGIYHYQAINIAESIIVYLKAVFIADVFVMSPLLFYQFWSFVSPGLLDRERRFVLPVTFFSVVFFAIGVAFAYTVILPFITDWLVQLTHEGGQVELLVTMQNAYSTAFTFLVMFGLVFELPLVIYFLALFGAATHRSLFKFWRYFVVISFIASAILTPPDPISQVLMAVPLNGLYGFGILVAWAVVRARERRDAAADGDGDAADHEGVGAASLRVMGAGLVLVVLASALIVMLIRTLPGVALADVVPASSRWVLGYNPAVLASNAPLDVLMTDALAADAPARVVEGAGVKLAEVTEVLVAGDGAGRRLALIRGEGLGARADALVAALGQAATRPAADYAVSVAALDEHTLALGSTPLVNEAIAALVGEAEGPPRTDLDERLLKRLEASGPVWAWLPEAASRATPLLGEAMARDVAAAGAWLRLDDGASLTFELRAPDDASGDALEARLDAARLRGGGERASAREVALIEAVRALAGAVAASADPATRARLAAVQGQLASLTAVPAPPLVPAFAALADHVEGWSVRRNDRWLHVTAELGDTPLEAVLGIARP